MRKTILKRHSVRKFIKTKISDTVIEDVLSFAAKAPSAGGLRSYETYVVKEGKIDKIAEIARQSWIKDASLAIVLCAYPEKSEKRYRDRGKNLYCIQDTTIYGVFIDLLLVELGYGTCWVGSFNVREIKSFLNIPDRLIPISLLIVGKEKE